MIRRRAAKTFEILLHSYDASSHMIVQDGQDYAARSEAVRHKPWIYGLSIDSFGISHQKFRIFHSFSSQIATIGAPMR